MAVKKKTVSYNLSLSDELNICGIHVKEKATINFESENDWEGSYELTFFNSRAKNTEILTEGDVVVDDLLSNVLIMTINPDDQGLESGKYYFEIFDTNEERIIIKGHVTIEL